MMVGSTIEDHEMAVGGGSYLEWEDEDESGFCSPLRLRGGGVGYGYEDVQPQQLDVHASASLLPQTVVEQTPQYDGSLAVKASTTTPCPNGYRDVKIEHFLIPASAVGSVDTSPGSPPPPQEYLSRVEYQVLSPDMELDPPDDDVSTVYTAPAPVHRSSGGAGGADDSSVATYNTSNRTRKRRRSRGRNLCSHKVFFLVSIALVFTAIVIGVAFVRDNDKIEATEAQNQDKDRDNQNHDNNDQRSRKEQEDVAPVVPSDDNANNDTSVEPKKATEDVVDGDDAGDKDEVHHHHHHSHGHSHSHGDGHQQPDSSGDVVPKDDAVVYTTS